MTMNTGQNGNPQKGPIMRPSEREHAANGPWEPAAGGTETPFRTRTGRTLLYCYQALTGRHAYLDVDTDLVLSQDGAERALGIQD